MTLNYHCLFDCLKEMFLVRALYYSKLYKDFLICKFPHLCAGAMSTAEGNSQRNQGIESACDACDHSIAPEATARPPFRRATTILGTSFQILSHKHREFRQACPLAWNHQEPTGHFLCLPRAICAAARENQHPFRQHECEVVVTTFKIWGSWIFSYLSRGRCWTSGSVGGSEPTATGDS